ncbi:hypothetical protein F4859DRAFT_465409 [Xylaria cf. heliscus]|nr:hypothetical protein F4859DRAFT_465409 [Xylaria cf. heliscus]
MVTLLTYLLTYLLTCLLTCQKTFFLCFQKQHLPSTPPFLPFFVLLPSTQLFPSLLFSSLPFPSPHPTPFPSLRTSRVGKAGNRASAENQQQQLRQSRAGCVS